MAKYDLAKKIDQARLKKYLTQLYAKGALVELKSLEKRSLSQNNYLHLLLSWYGLEFGYTVGFVKLELFKKLVNGETFVIDRQNKKEEYYQDVRSSADLSKAELTLCIDRFRDWSSKECSFYLPEPSDLLYLREIQVELEKSKQYTQ